MIRINGTDRESQSAVPSNQNIGMYHVNANKKMYEPQRGNDFELVIPGLDGIVDKVTGQVYENAEEIIRLAVSKASIPHFSIDPITQRRGNSVMKYAGTPSFQEGKLSIRDWIGNNTVNILYAWQNKAYNVDTDKTGLLEDYKNSVIHFQKALQLDSKNNAVRYNLAKAYAKDGDYGSAKSVYMELLKADAKNWDAYLELAKVCLQLNDNSGAEKYLVYLQEMNPSFKKNEVADLLANISN